MRFIILPLQTTTNYNIIKQKQKHWELPIVADSLSRRNVAGFIAMGLLSILKKVSVEVGTI